MEYNFPENFWWGTASSALQTEGTKNKKGMSTWDMFYKMEPNRFYDGVGPDVVSDFYTNYKSDIKLMKSLKLNTFRTSISWSRLIPGGIGEPDKDAVNFYNNVINELITNNIEPIINLYHFDMPIELDEIGGWTSKIVVDAYVAYAKTVFQLFGDRVKNFITFNEPIVPVEGVYLYGHHYPFDMSFKKGVQAGFNTMLAHAKAVKVFRELKIDSKIGIVLNLTPSYPRSQHETDLNAAHIADLLFNRSFLDPAVKGIYPEDLIALLKKHELMPDYTTEELEIIKNNIIDYLGVNYYHPRRVKVKETLPNPFSPIMPEWFFDNYSIPGQKMNVSRGWEIYPKGIYDLSINLRDNYGNVPYFISESGMGVQSENSFIDDKGQIQDDYRIEFIKEHLIWLHKAMEEGCNAFGYQMWTFIDNWSFINAYKNRYGFVSLNYKTQERTIKKSGEWIKQAIENSGF